MFILACVLLALGALLLFTTSINLITSPKIQLGWFALFLWAVAEFILLVFGSGMARVH